MAGPLVPLDMSIVGDGESVADLSGCAHDLYRSQTLSAVTKNRVTDVDWFGGSRRAVTEIRVEGTPFHCFLIRFDLMQSDQQGLALVPPQP